MEETSKFETQPLDEEIKITYDECLAIANDVGRDMPVIGTIFKLHELRINTQERRFAKRFKAFLLELKKGNVTAEERARHAKKYENNAELRQKENEYIMQALDEYEDDVKAETLARFATAYYRGDMNEDLFFEILEINRRMFVADYSVLNGLGARSIMFSECVAPAVRHNLNRLVGLGLVGENKLGTFQEDNIMPHYFLTDIGKIFVEKMRLVGWYVTLTTGKTFEEMTSEERKEMEKTLFVD